MNREALDRVKGLMEFESVASRFSDSVRWALAACRLIEAGVPVNLRTNAGLDAVSWAVFGFMQGGPGVALPGFYSGTATTAPTATTFTTDGVNIPANAAAGQLIVTTSGATRFGIVQSNTSATNSVLTIDRWYDATALPADRGVAAASTPTAGAWAADRWRCRCARIPGAGRCSRRLSPRPRPTRR
jgi:hypothetical protein